MYRPNRIGPHPLVTLESVAVVDTALQFNVLDDNPRAIASKDAPNEFHNAETWRFTFSILIPAVSGVAIGVKVSGRSLHDRPDYMLSYAGAFVGGSGDEGVVVRPIVGRVGVSGNAASNLDQYALVPAIETGHIQTSGVAEAPIVSSMNGTVVMGDFAPGGADPLTEDLFVGFWMMNFGATDGNLEKVQASMSGYRYGEDLRPFDPNR